MPGRPAMTAFRRAARYQQARWREASGLPIGTQPIAPKAGGPRPRLVGSRLPLEFARETGANFLTPAALAAVEARLAYTEPRQSLDQQRLWADLLWSHPLTFNLFGDLAADPARADRALHKWFPDVPGRVSEVRFVHSPGWFDPAYINSLRSFDAMFVLDLDAGGRGLVVFDVRYHERAKAEDPRHGNLERYAEVGKRSRAFARGAIDALNTRNDLVVTWITHLLMFSMLQTRADGWKWGRYVVVHPKDNVDMADLTGRYRAKLADDSTFATITLEALLASGALPRPATAALRKRYLLP